MRQRQSPTRRLQTETGRPQRFQNVAISAKDLMDSLGGTVSSSLLVVSPNSLTMPAGGSASVDVQVSLSDVAPGVYRGALVIRSNNDGRRMIPLMVVK